MTEIIVIYGPPCSGKTTYVKNQMGEKDIVWDYDAIIPALTGKTEHTTAETIVGIRAHPFRPADFRGKTS